MANPYLIRHPPVCLQNICYGQTDLELQPNWNMWLNEIIPNMQPLDRVYSSSLKRTSLVASALAEYWGCPLILDDHLLELNFGKWDGRPWVDIPENEINDWGVDLWLNAPPQGESAFLLTQRVQEWWESVAPDCARERIAVVGHGGPMRVLLGGFQRHRILQNVRHNIDYGAWLEWLC